MTADTLTKEEWLRLYAAAQEVKEMAPWKWMEEHVVFGVQNPGTAELGFVSVMGSLGEHYAVALYLGTRALFDFLQIQYTPPAAQTEAHGAKILEIPQVQVSFENRKQIEPEDYAQIKELGLKFRGRHAWPLFRGYAPGRFPWFITAAEGRFLTHALEQLLEVAPRYERRDVELFQEGHAEIYMRIPEQKAGVLEWRSEWQQVEPPIISLPEPKIEQPLLKKAKRLPQRAFGIELDLFLVPSPVLEEEISPRPFFPYNFIVVDAESGYVLNADLLLPHPSLDDMRAQAPQKLIEVLLRLGSRPQYVAVSQPILYELLEPVADQLEIELIFADFMPMLEEARSAFFDFMI